MASEQATLGGPAPLHRVVGWRSALRRELTLLVALKLVALGFLWWAFFSPPHRTPVDPVTAGRRLAVERAAAALQPPTAQPAPGESP